MDFCLSMLVCPLCQAEFRQQERTLRCENNHAFDLAREGYVYLLPSGGKRPKFLGDSKEMLRARRAFFDAGFYAPLASPKQCAFHALWGSRTQCAFRAPWASPAQCAFRAPCALRVL